MIEIKILNPHLADKYVLRETAKYLLSLAGDQMVAEHEMPILPPGIHTESPVPAGERITNELPSQIHSLVPDMDFEITSSDAPIPNILTSALPNPFSHRELDIKGLPWDNRIHARTKTKTNEGNWKLMRGVDSNLVKQVEAELLGTLNAPIIPSAPNISQITPVIPSNIPAPPVEIDTNSAWFMAMARITAVVKEGEMTHAEVMTIVKSVGIESIPLIAQRPDLIPAILDRIEYFVKNGEFAQ